MDTNDTHDKPRDPLYGDVGASRALRLVQTPRSVGRLAKAFAACFVIGPAVLLAAPWQQNLTGAGRVVAYAPAERQQLVEAPIDGRIVKWWVQEGSTVKAGDPLLEISDIDPNLVTQLETQRAALRAVLVAYGEKVKSSELQVGNLQTTRDMAVNAAAAYVEMAKQKVVSSQAALDSADANVRAAQFQFDRTKALLADGIVSRRDYELAERDLEVARRSLEGARAALTGANNDLDGQRANLDKTRADAESKVNAAVGYLNEAKGQAEDARVKLASLEVTLSRQQSRVVSAPRDGTVFRLIVNGAGQTVKFTEPLLVLVPDTADRAIELYVDGNDAPLITPGSPVRVQFEGWPAVQFVGWPSVAVGTFGGRVALVDATDDGRGKFRMLVSPDPGEPAWPDARFLRQGVRAKGWVLLNRVTIGYELWRQLNGFPPVLAAEEPKDGGGGGKAGGSGSDDKTDGLARKRVK